MSGDADWMWNETTATTTLAPENAVVPTVPVASQVMVPYGLIALGIAVALLCYGYANARRPRVKSEALGKRFLDASENDLGGDEDAFLGDGQPPRSDVV